MGWLNHRRYYTYPEKEALLFNLVNEYYKSYNVLDADDFLEFASDEMDEFDLDDVESNTRDQNEDDLWWDMRIGRITSSTIYEASRCQTAGGSLVNRILGNTTVSSSYGMQRGLNLQPEVIDVVAEELEEDLTPSGILLDPLLPALGASPDAVGPNFVVEIKCPSSNQAVSNYVLPNRFLVKKFYAQIQLQMRMKHAKLGYFVVADPNFESTKEVDIIKIRYDHWYTKSLIKKAMRFWKRYVFDEIVECL